MQVLTPDESEAVWPIDTVDYLAVRTAHEQLHRRLGDRVVLAILYFSSKGFKGGANDFAAEPLTEVPPIGDGET